MIQDYFNWWAREATFSIDWGLDDAPPPKDLSVMRYVGKDTPITFCETFHQRTLDFYQCGLVSIEAKELAEQLLDFVRGGPVDRSQIRAGFRRVVCQATLATLRQFKYIAEKPYFRWSGKSFPDEVTEAMGRLSHVDERHFQSMREATLKAIRNPTLEKSRAVVRSIDRAIDAVRELEKTYVDRGATGIFISEDGLVRRDGYESDVDLRRHKKSLILLRRLHRDFGCRLDYEVLEKAAWDMSVVDAKTRLKDEICKLRRRIACLGLGITTEREVGYRLESKSDEK